MKTTTKIAIVTGIIVLSLLVSSTVLTHAQTYENDYIAYVFDVDGFHTIDADALDIYYPVGYIPITGSATYTYDKANIVTRINLSNPSAADAMRTSIIEYATTKGYNVKRIMYRPISVAKI